jgi:hypothetical protein
MHPLLQTNSYMKGGSVEAEEMEAPADEPTGDLTQAASELLAAIHGGSPEEVAEAMRACFKICDAEPHYEGEHE